MVTLLIIVAVVVVMIALNALYVAGEFAAVSARKSRIHAQAQSGDRLARLLLPVLEDTQRLDNYIAACQVGITLSSLALGIYGQQQIAPLISPWVARISPGAIATTGDQTAALGISAILVLIFLTSLQVVLGELVPKSVAIQYPEKTALATTAPIRWSADLLLRPLIVVLNGSGALVLRLLGVSYQEGHSHIHSPEEIEILVSESAKGGLLDAEERQLLHNAFRIGELSAGQVMIPRTRLVTAEAGTPVPDLLRLAADSAYTRIPIYEEHIDHIVGVVHLKDLCRISWNGQKEDVRSIIRKVPYVPETAPAVEVWNTLNDSRSYVAIVFDEYGGTAGMITQEDLIEELFGEVQDEFDEEKAPLTRAGDCQFIVRGDMLIDSVNDMLGTNLPSDDSYTVAGLVLGALGRAPEVGDVVEINEMPVEVTAVAGRSVREVRLTLPSGIEPLIYEEES
jgi:putative hemolysin